METTPPPNVSELLVAWGQGDEAARDRLVPVIYDELRRVARHCLRADPQQQTLQTSALINEAFVELIKAPVTWQNRAHFFGIAARLMRQILVHYAETRRRQKRGGGQARLSLTAADAMAETQAAEVLALNDALQALAAFDAQKSSVVELRFFGGLTIEETATALNISTATVEREWRAARAWLQTQLRKS
ncbi:MAG: sigma-70 family RNA polymerase sigma factor [Acidobacteria bacterium]|nr:sigma-70 family RNA polymerase sigma factor [Acidobacteriota bacterium]MBI3424579.1 sigma-70 family RNA polymerase sigma factor [Acidobacteriota bacterium]